MYLDDIIVFSSSFEQHEDHLRTVFLLLEDAGVTLPLTMSKIFHKEVDYLATLASWARWRSRPK